MSQTSSACPWHAVDAYQFAERQLQYRWTAIVRNHLTNATQVYAIKQLQQNIPLEFGNHCSVTPLNENRQLSIACKRLSEAVQIYSIDCTQKPYEWSGFDKNGIAVTNVVFTCS